MRIAMLIALYGFALGFGIERYAEAGTPGLADLTFRCAAALGW